MEVEIQLGRCKEVSITFVSAMTVVCDIAADFKKDMKHSVSMALSPPKFRVDICRCSLMIRKVIKEPLHI